MGRLSQGGTYFSHGISFESYFMSRMDQAVQDGISDGGFPDEFMPSIDGELAGDEGGAPIVTIV
jgi:hypothetical protein